MLARVEGEASETARVHEVWTKRVGEEVAGPLRASLTKGEWAKWTGLEQSLGMTVKDYDKTLEKVQQAQQKGNTKSSKSNQSKLLSSQSHLAQLGSTLTSSLPAFLSASQQLDLSHAAFLKEALVRHGTLCSDLGRERMEAGERLLVGVFEVDEHSEMQGWALREGQKTTAPGGGSNGYYGGGSTINEFGQTGAREESIREDGQMLPPPVPAVRERQNCEFPPSQQPRIVTRADTISITLQPPLAPHLHPLHRSRCLPPPPPPRPSSRAAASSRACSSATARRPRRARPSTATLTVRPAGRRST